MKKKDPGRFYRWKLMDSHTQNRKIPEGFEMDSGTFQNLFGGAGEEALERHRIQKVRKRWEKAAGPLARHSHPHRFHGSTLEIMVEKPIYGQEILFYRSDILKSLQAEGDMNIRDIRVRSGTVKREQNRTVSERKTASGPEKEVDPDFLRALRERGENHS